MSTNLQWEQVIKNLKVSFTHIDTSTGLCSVLLTSEKIFSP